MKKPYDKYFPDKERTKLVQINLDLELHGKLKKHLKEKDLFWNEFLRGLIQKYLDDIDLKKKT